LNVSLISRRNIIKNKWRMVTPPKNYAPITTELSLSGRINKNAYPLEYRISYLLYYACIFGNPAAIAVPLL